MNFAGTCDFETDLCSWSNAASGDDFDWIRNQGVTITSNTGPTGDHTLGSASGRILVTIEARAFSVFKNGNDSFFMKMRIVKLNQ